MLPSDPWSRSFRRELKEAMGPFAPTEGGCWIVAHAIKEVLGGELRTIYGDWLGFESEAEGCEPPAHHVAVELNGMLLDGDGIHDEATMLAKAAAWDGIGEPVFGDFNPHLLRSCQTPEPTARFRRKPLYKRVVKVVKRHGAPPIGIASNPPSDWRFAWHCPSPPDHWPDLDFGIVDYIVDHADEIEPQEFLAEVGRSEVEGTWWGGESSWAETGYDPCADWSMGWFRSTYPDGTPIMFHTSSGIEHVWEPAGYAFKKNPPRARRALKKTRRAVGKRRECYPAAEVVYHAGGGRRAGLTPMQQRHEGESHWWVRGPNGEVLDPASAQFRTPVPYARGRGRGFLTKRPSRRARQLARRAKVKLNPDRGCKLVRLEPEEVAVAAIEAVTDRDVYQVMDDAEWLFGLSGINADGHELQHEACVSPEGEVLGVSAFGLLTNEPDENDPLDRARYSFSVAVSEKARRRGIARALVNSILSGYSHEPVLIEGKVINPYMAKLLESLGFEYDREYDEGDWSDWDRQTGRRMYMPNPPRRVVVMSYANPPKLRSRVIKSLTGYDSAVISAYVGRKKAGHIQVSRTRPGSLVQQCQDDLRQIQGTRPGITAYVVWKSHVYEPFREKGIGNFLYEEALDFLRERHAPGAVALVPMHCLDYGTTSSQARRVWSSLARRREHATERAVLANPASLHEHLQLLRPALAAAANEAIAEFDWEAGGACDEVASALHGVLAEAGIGSIEGGHDGDDHAWLIAFDSRSRAAFGVDVPPGVYETGGGYSWKQVHGATVQPEDVAVWRVDYQDEWLDY